MCSLLNGINTEVKSTQKTHDVRFRVPAHNLRGVVLCCRAVLPGMIARGRGRIINIASSAMPVAYFSSYATSKAALVRFTETIAGEVKPYGASTFAVGPGTVRTAMAEHSLRSDDGQKWLPWFKRIFDQSDTPNFASTTGKRPVCHHVSQVSTFPGYNSLSHVKDCHFLGVGADAPRISSLNGRSEVAARLYRLRGKFIQ